MRTPEIPIPVTPSASPSVGPPRRARKCENVKRKVQFTGRVPFAQHLKPFIFYHFWYHFLRSQHFKKPRNVYTPSAPSPVVSFMIVSLMPFPVVSL